MRKVVQGLQELLEVIEDIAMVNAIEEGAKTGARFQRTGI